MSDPWITTYSGKEFHILEPSYDEICIEDIAHALSLTCRFGGHAKRFYSVAEHSVYVSILCQDKNKMAGLLHDASEAYIGDVVSPLKSVLPQYKDIERDIMMFIADRFGFEFPLSEDVHNCDLAQLGSEARELFLEVPQWAALQVGDRSGMKPYFLAPEKAEELFLTWYNIYKGRT